METCVLEGWSFVEQGLIVLLYGMVIHGGLLDRFLHAFAPICLFVVSAGNRTA